MGARSERPDAHLSSQWDSAFQTVGLVLCHRSGSFEACRLRIVSYIMESGDKVQILPKANTPYAGGRKSVIDLPTSPVSLSCDSKNGCHEPLTSSACTVPMSIWPLPTILVQRAHVGPVCKLRFVRSLRQHPLHSFTPSDSWRSDRCVLHLDIGCNALECIHVFNLLSENTRKASTAGRCFRSTIDSDPSHALG